METKEKKKLWVFIAVAYGVTYAMNLLMIIGFKKQYDLTLFMNAQMLYPAAGVILGKLIFRKEGEKLPMTGYITVLVTTALCALCNIGSIVLHIDPIESAVAKIDIWNTLSTIVLIMGSLVSYVAFWVCGKEKRENAGLNRKNIKWSIILIAVFIALFFGRSLISIFLSDLFNHTTEAFDSLKKTLFSANSIITVLCLPINFILSYMAFFGEEYGWRYYLQPIMQKKMGKRLGVLLLGLVWGVWHIGADFMYYTKEYGAQAFVMQLITCISIAIFFGYVYMKTENIWTLAIMHFLNNNLAALLGGGGSSALQDQVVLWSTVALHAISSIVICLFIFLPLYNKDKNAEKEI